jgi:PAS domain S-box-containing protein
VPITISSLRTGRLVEINDTACELFGSRRADILGKTAEEAGLLFDPQDLAETQRLLREKGVIRDREIRFRTAGRPEAWGAMSASIIEVDGEPCVMAAVMDVTDRRNAEEALRASEARFAAAFNSTGVVMVISRLSDDRIVEINRPFLEQSGYERDQVIGKTAAEIGVFADPHDAEGLRHELQERGSVRDYELEIVRPTGEVRHTVLSADIVQLQGEPHLITAAVDTTARFEAAEALRVSEERYRNLVLQTADGVLALDREGHIVDVNPAMAGYLGRPVRELIGRLWTDFIEPENLAETPFRRPEMESGRPATFERRIVRPDGSVVELEVHARGYENGLMIGTARDIGSRKAAEQERAHLTRVIEQSADSIMIADPDGMLVYINPAMELSSGWSREAAAGRNFREIQSEKRTCWRR